MWKGWGLGNELFDLRAERSGVATPIPIGKVWRSEDPESYSRDMALRAPQLDRMPRRINVHIDLSRRPAAITIAYEVDLVGRETL